MTTLDLINEALATVSDPELHRPLPDLGMVESVSISGSLAEIKILLTISGCPMQDRLKADITAAVTKVAEINEQHQDFFELQIKQIIRDFRREIENKPA